MKKIDLQGAYNFRDVGGYQTKDGKVVRYGKIYRSDELSHLTNDDLLVIEKLNIHTIIDYRNDSERKDNEDRLWKDAQIIYLDPKADVAAMASHEDLKVDDFHKHELTAQFAKTLMTEQNYQFVYSKTSQNAYKEMFHILLDEKNIATVQHCRGGKDRTGYGIALILLLLGVDESQVISDYLLTNEYKKEKNENSLKKALEETNNPDFVLGLRYLKEAQLDFLMTALNTIKRDFNNVENYAKKVFHLTDNDILKLREIYLEDIKNG